MGKQLCGTCCLKINNNYCRLYNVILKKNQLQTIRHKRCIEQIITEVVYGDSDGKGID